MRFLADENFPGDAVAALRATGYDVAWVREEAPGSADREVLAKATGEKRVLLTFDKDFGELAWRAKLPTTSGVVLFRIPMPRPRDVGSSIVRLICSRQDWCGRFSVVGPGRVRMRDLPH